MKDPYEVLGVGKNASMEEIRAAYKELIKKYHPDKYQNNPLADLAQEKMKEINEAYEQLNQIKGGGFCRRQFGIFLWKRCKHRFYHRFQFSKNIYRYGKLRRGGYYFR